MRTWLEDASSSSLPSEWLRPFLVRHPASGETSLYAPLARGMLRLISTQGGSRDTVMESLVAFMKWEQFERETVDPEEATPRLLQYIQHELGTTPNAEDDEYADARVASFGKEVAAPALNAIPPPHLLKPRVAATPLPDFHALFTSRLNSDEQLLKEISRHTALSTDRLDNLLRLVDRYGDGARDLLAALAADQQITEETVKVFVEGANDAARLRALEVHSRSATAAPRPRRPDCIALHYAAKQMLGHLQRREAVRSMRELRRRWKLGPQLERTASTRRQRILESCEGVEDALCDLALFRGGEKTEVKAYLDHLALFIWASIQSQRAGSLPTTRQLMSDIWRNLRTLGFGIASGENFFHNSNSFLNVVLCCPGQRESIPLTLMAIVCAVARRLGVAASLINTPSVVMGVVVEDGEEPESWSGDNASKEWSRFFAYPSVEEDQFIVELGGFKRFFSLQAAQPDRINSYMEPASPAVIVERAARNLLNAGQESPQLMQADDSAAPSSTPGQRPAQDPLGALGDYLSGRQATPPSPLSLALLRSSLSSLPPTHDLASRDNPYTARQDADYAAAWIFRAISPELMARGPDNWLIEAFLNESVNDAPYQCDVTLLLEIHGCDVGFEMGWARRRALRDGGEDGQSGSDESEDERSYSEKPRASAQLRSFIIKTLRSDKRPYNGAGGFTTARDPAALRLNDETQPPNVRFKYAIGTVFHHRVHDYYGVVLGRDTVCRASEGWIRQMRVVSRRSPSRPYCTYAQPRTLTTITPHPTRCRTPCPQAAAISPFTTSW